MASCPSWAGQWLAAKVWGSIHCGERFPEPKEACPETEELFLYKGDRNNSFYGLFFPLREPPSYNLWFAQRQHLQASSPAPYCSNIVFGLHSAHSSSARCFYLLALGMEDGLVLGFPVAQTVKTPPAVLKTWV